MSMLMPSVHSTIFIALLPLLNACAPYQTSGVAPARSRLASITTTSGAALMFDSLPAPQISGDTIYGRQDGVPRAIPTSDVAVMRWVAASGEQAATRATASHGRPAGLELAAVGPGAHVRIAAPSLGWNGKTGTLTEVRGDTLLVRTRGILFRATRVPASAITRLEVSQNHDAHNAALLVGGLVGGVGGALAGYALRDRTPCDTGWAGLGCNLSFKDVGAPLLGGSVGALLGILIADAAGPERWTLVGLHKPRVGLVPLPRRRLGLGLALAF